MIPNLKVLLIGVGLTAILAIGSSVVSYQKGVSHGKQIIQSEWDKEKMELAQAHARELEAALKTTRDLQAKLDNQRKVHRDEITRITHAYAAVVDSLRDRPDSTHFSGTPGDSASGAEPAGWCTGAQLYRDHADAFAREAALAAQLQSALGACVSAYDEVRNSMSGKK